MPDFTRAIIKHSNHSAAAHTATCKYGHVLTLDNTFLTHKGYLGCKQCKLNEKRRYRANNRAKIKTANASYYQRTKKP